MAAVTDRRKPKTLAALASIPGRALLLPRVLDLLRPQVDEIRVYLNGYPSVPDAVRELADDWVHDRDNHGAERKFWWASDWDGIYLSVDDDIFYPPDYVARMVEAVEERGRELVTCHGRVFREKATHIWNVTGIGKFHERVDCSRPVNCGGTGVMAWDARELSLPTEWPQKNIADLQVAAWAQHERVPIWLLAHQAHWLESPMLTDPNGIYRSSCLERHARRNAILSATRPWRVWAYDEHGQARPL